MHRSQLSVGSPLLVGSRHVVAFVSFALIASVFLVKASGTPTAPDVKTALEQQLRKLVTNPTNPDKVTVRVVPDGQAAQGHFKSVTVESSPAMIRGRSRFSQFSAQATDVRVDVDKLIKDSEIEFTGSKNQTVTAVASPEDFAFILAKGKHTKNMNLKVTYEENRIRVTGNWKMFVFRGPMDMVGSFRIKDGDELHLVVESLQINDRGAPRSVIRQFEEQINPLVETSEFLFKPKLKSVKIEGNKLTLSS